MAMTNTLSAAASPALVHAAELPPSAATREALPEQVRSGFDYMPAMLAGNLTGIAVVALLYLGDVDHLLIAGWALPACLVLALRAWLFRRFMAADPHSGDDWERWLNWWNATILGSGAMWGLSAWLLYPWGDSIQQTALIIIVYTFCVAVVPVLASQPSVFLTYGALCFVPMVLRIVLVGDAYSLQLGGILLLIFSLTTLLARNYRQALERAIDLKLQGDRLLVELRAQKRAAEEAHRIAETASRAKTQFFAAASHDLRQPLHAMGLFAETLRSKVHDDEVAKLVNCINESVDALEALFSELLDITRIDAGGVQVDPQQFEVEQILRRLRLHFEPAAFEKGLALRLRGGAHVLHADPVLVERIMCNLVANAIRYTNDGSVLVGARRRGEKIVLQVWDTGPGIAVEDQTRIFDEFYQLAVTSAAAADGADGVDSRGRQPKGLGLGLAIVRRLAGLMHAELGLMSRPGRGTVFWLSLPAGRLVRSAAPAPAHRPLPSGTLKGRRILMIEDDPAVRGGLEVLLKDWHAELDSFESVAAATAWAEASAPTSSLPPELLIVDYRIGEGRTGVDAITALRACFGQPIPAIVVTGSTLSGLEHEAHRHDFHLLIKPVVPNKLRAMIAFKLGVKPG